MTSARPPITTATTDPDDGRERSRAEVLARTTTKRALRGVGMVTGDLRPVPDFLVIGAKRGGTTSLWRYLNEHPGVLTLFPKPEKIKGLYFFDENFGRGERWYRSHFPTTATRALSARRLGHPVVAGEASPYYLYHPLAPQRAHAVAPDALVIAVLRDPVERAFSHYKERRTNGTEPLTFEEALAAEPARLAGEEERILADPGYVSFAHRHASYVDQGRYAPMLARWFDAFGRDRVIVAPSEEMYAAPQPFVDRVVDELGLPRRTLEHPEPYNAEPDRGFDPALRARLADELAPDIAAVEALLDRPMPWGRDALTG
jgi:sulfotransferase family protein